jgi:hypothetical protein
MVFFCYSAILESLIETRRGRKKIMQVERVKYVQNDCSGDFFLVLVRKGEQLERREVSPDGIDNEPEAIASAISDYWKSQKTFH